LHGVIQISLDEVVGSLTVVTRCTWVLFYVSVFMCTCVFPPNGWIYSEGLYFEHRTGGEAGIFVFYTHKQTNQ